LYSDIRYLWYLKVNKCFITYQRIKKFFRGHLPVGVSRINKLSLIPSNVPVTVLVTSCGRSSITNTRPLTNVSDFMPITYPSVFPVQSFCTQHVSPTAEESSVFNHVCLPYCSFTIYISHFHLPPSRLGMRQLKQNIFQVI